METSVIQRLSLGSLGFWVGGFGAYGLLAVILGAARLFLIQMLFALARSPEARDQQHSQQKNAEDGKNKLRIKVI